LIWIIPKARQSFITGNRLRTFRAITISFHGLGNSFRGILGVSGYFQSGDRPPVPLSDVIFRFSYQENRDPSIQRFEPWLEAAVTRGLEFWRRTLV